MKDQILFANSPLGEYFENFEVDTIDDYTNPGVIVSTSPYETPPEEESIIETIISSEIDRQNNICSGFYTCHLKSYEALKNHQPKITLQLIILPIIICAAIFSTKFQIPILVFSCLLMPLFLAIYFDIIAKYLLLKFVEISIKLDSKFFQIFNIIQETELIERGFKTNLGDSLSSSHKKYHRENGIIIDKNISDLTDGQMIFGCILLRKTSKRCLNELSTSFQPCSISNNYEHFSLKELKQLMKNQSKYRINTCYYWLDLLTIIQTGKSIFITLSFLQKCNLFYQIINLHHKFSKLYHQLNKSIEYHYKHFHYYGNTNISENEIKLSCERHTNENTEIYNILSFGIRNLCFRIQNNKFKNLERLKWNLNTDYHTDINICIGDDIWTLVNEINELGSKLKNFKAQEYSNSKEKIAKNETCIFENNIPKPDVGKDLEMIEDDIKDDQIFEQMFETETITSNTDTNNLEKKKMSREERISLKKTERIEKESQTKMNNNQSFSNTLSLITELETALMIKNINKR